MIWPLEFTASARRETARLGLPIRIQLEKDLQLLASDPFQGKILHGRLRGIRSWRSGDYRILYTVRSTEGKLMIYRIAHRREVYR